MLCKGEAGGWGLVGVWGAVRGADYRRSNSREVNTGVSSEPWELLIARDLDGRTGTHTNEHVLLPASVLGVHTLNDPTV